MDTAFFIVCNIYFRLVFNPSARQKLFFFSPQTHLETHVNLYSFERLMKLPFPGIFGSSTIYSLTIQLH